jgi:predicted transcriptional regulator of viral defense system
MAPTPPAQHTPPVTTVERGGPRPWRFLTNHAHVLLAIAADPDARVEDIAEQVGITTRQALTILRDLEEDGYLQRTRTGRRTHYTLSPARPFRHPSIAHHKVAELLAIFSDESPHP